MKLIKAGQTKTGKFSYVFGGNEMIAKNTIHGIIEVQSTNGKLAGITVSEPIPDDRLVIGVSIDELDDLFVLTDEFTMMPPRAEGEKETPYYHVDLVEVS